MPDLFIVHCVDTEGPLYESVEALFTRIKNVFGINLNPTIENLRRIRRGDKKLLCDIHEDMHEPLIEFANLKLSDYLDDWSKLDKANRLYFSPSWRNQFTDSSGNPWSISWHCLDQYSFATNPRRKAYGYGAIFRYYRDIIKDSDFSSVDELNWHYHPLPINWDPVSCATSLCRSYDHLYKTLSMRLIEDNWFPVVNRPGFHAERQDINLFLEQWIPFDYACQSYEAETTQPDLSSGRFGDWRRAPLTWRGYNPSHDDYQTLGNCKRWIFRILNIGTRHKLLKEEHIRQAFSEAVRHGSAILAVTNHDFRNMSIDIEDVARMIENISSEFPRVNYHYSGARKAACRHLGLPMIENNFHALSLIICDNTLVIKNISCYSPQGSQPFLAIRTLDGNYHHDNLDIQIPGKEWTYVFDWQTLPLECISKVSVGCAFDTGFYSTASIEL